MQRTTVKQEMGELERSVDLYKKNWRIAALAPTVVPFAMWCLIVISLGRREQPVLLKDVIAYLSIGLMFWTPALWYWVSYHRKLRILHHAISYPARQLGKRTFWDNELSEYQYADKTYPSSRYIHIWLPTEVRKRALPVGFLDPRNPRESVLVLVGGEPEDPLLPPWYVAIRTFLQSRKSHSGE